MNKIKIFTIIFLGIGEFFIYSNLLFAQNTGAQNTGISISPSNFELTANPGDTITNRIKVFNPSDNIIGIKMEVEDIKAVGEKGDVVVAPEEEETYSLKRWVKVEPEEFVLQPKEQKFIDFTIAIPFNAEPGGKYGSILPSIKAVISQEQGGSGIALKVGSLILLTVSGEVEENVSIKEFSVPSFLEYGPVPFTIKFLNEGSVHARPRGFITVSSWWGKKATDVEFAQLNVIPGTTRSIEAKWNEKWLFGKYTATLVGNYGTGNNPFESIVINFWVIPWKIILAILIILLIIFTFFFKTRKRWKLAMKALVKGDVN